MLKSKLLRLPCLIVTLGIILVLSAQPAAAAVLTWTGGNGTWDPTTNN